MRRRFFVRNNHPAVSLIRFATSVLDVPESDIRDWWWKINADVYALRFHNGRWIEFNGLDLHRAFTTKGAR